MAHILIQVLKSEFGVLVEKTMKNMILLYLSSENTPNGESTILLRWIS